MGVLYLPMKLLALLLLFVIPADAAKRCQACARDSRGRIQRSAAARRQFRAENPCPATGSTTGPCKGWVIDHVKPLECGGEDNPRTNMAWQTTSAAKAKDKTEGKCL